MPYRAALLLCLFPALAVAQSSNAATLKWAYAQQDAQTGGFRNSPQDKPSLRATSAAIRVIKYQHGELPHAEKVKAFVLKCYDPQAGAFAEPGGKPDATIDSVGIMAAVELGIPQEKFPKAVEYLHKHAKTFEEVRIGAAALEALQLRPEWLGEWFKIADKQLRKDGTAGEGDGVARETASVIAMKLRLGIPEKALLNHTKLDDVLQAGQWSDGGYGAAGAKRSDLGSTYRVMRAFMLMRERPKDRMGMRTFIESCRNPDGGYGVTPGAASSMGGTYYATTVTKWLDQMEKK
jgi:prenyltransferase beta subunit